MVPSLLCYDTLRSYLVVKYNLIIIHIVYPTFPMTPSIPPLEGVLLVYIYCAQQKSSDATARITTAFKIIFLPRRIVSHRSLCQFIFHYSYSTWIAWETAEEGAILIEEVY